MEVEIEDLKKGVVLVINDEPLFIKKENLISDTFNYEDKVLIKAIKGKKENGKNILIPVKITDKELSQGVEIEYQDRHYNKKTLKIPKRRVFLPQNFYIVYPELGESGKNGGKNGALILEVHPKMTQHFKLDVEETADYGIVVRGEYEDDVKIKITDLLNRTGYRDINLLTYLRGRREDKWGINMENLMETQYPRKIDLGRTQSLGERVLLELRLDNVEGEGGIHPGANFIYHRQNKELNIGNVDKKVQDNLHLQMKFKEKIGDVVLRMEGFSLEKSEDFKLRGLLIEKLGAQINFNNLPYGMQGSFGNLRVKIEENLDQGTVDDKLNFRLDQSYQFGTLYPRFESKEVTYNLTTGVRLIGIGRNIWLRGRLSFNLNFGANTSLQYELNDDFIVLSGEQFHYPWQNRRLTLIHYKDLVEDKTIMGKLNLQYLFIEGIEKRTNYSTPFADTLEVSLGTGYELKILGYGVPLEVFTKKDKIKGWQFGLNLSLRQWI